MNQRISEFWNEPVVKKYFRSPSEFIKLVKQNYYTDNPLTVIRRVVAPIIIPIELEPGLCESWKIVKENLPKPINDLSRSS